MHLYLEKPMKNVRTEDQKCFSCGESGSFISYQHEEDIHLERVNPYFGVLYEHMEDCGFLCLNCGWGNAGAREKQP